MAFECLPYGKRLFPTIVDDIAASSPDKTFVLLPKTSDPKDGFNSITYGAFALAIDRCARWLESSLGCSKNFDTLSFMSHGRDFRYPIFLFAAVKTGYKAQFVSPRNSLAAQLSLLDATACELFVVPEDPLPIVSEILQQRHMKSITMPSLEFFLAPSHGDDLAFPYNKTFDQARFEPLVVLQTSGSTGTPKAIVATHGTFAAMDAFQLLPLLNGGDTVCEIFKGSRWLNGFPFYHTGAYLFLLGYAVYYDITTVLAPPAVLSASLIDSLHEHAQCDAAILPPSLVYPVFELPDGKKRLSSMKFVAYAGGPLPRKHGDIMRSEVKLVNLLGSTETAMYPILLHDHDWEYVRYSDFLGHEFRLHSNDLYEMVIVRNKLLDMFQGVFCTFPDLEEYHTRELYTEHPTMKGFWKNAGRVDDVIAFSNGEKFNPVDSEKTVSGHPAVSACLVTGRARFQASLIIEPKEVPTSSQEATTLLNTIWPVIELANTQCLGTGRIARDLVMFTSADKGLPRTEKGTVKRVLAEQLYQADLDRLYEAAGDMNGSLYPTDKLEESKTESLESYLTRLVARRSRKRDVSKTAEFAQIGLDSLQIMSLVKDINAFVATRGHPQASVEFRDILSNSSVSKLSNYLESRTEYLV